MDPLSGLGAAAAASQLFEQGIKIAKFLVELYTKSQAPDFIQREVAQIEQLVKISRLVQENKSLQQEDLIASSLASCSRTATKFLEFLSKYVVTDEDSKIKTVQKVFSVMLKEKEITQYYDDLEREKSSLVLCIQQIDSKLLNSVNLKVDEVVIGIGEISLAMNDTARNAKYTADTLPGMAEAVADINRKVETIHETVMEFTLKHRTTMRTIAPLPAPPPNVKSYYLVPSRRVRGFIGREDILKKIEAAFSSTDDYDEGPCIVVIRAMGGQGKTQVALEYCYRAKDRDFQAIFWADATSENTLKKSYETTAARIKDPDQSIDRERGVDYVKEKLAEWPEKWLLVLDNYDDPISFNNLRDYIPDTESGCILITTRHADTDALAEPSENAVELPGLSLPDALSLLYKQSQVRETDENHNEASRIVDRLGYHPLAITQAGSYIRQRKIQLDEFSGHYNDQREFILKQTPQMTTYRRKLNDSEKETALSVFTTWELSFIQLEARDDIGDLESDFLTLIAFFDCKDISEKLFKSFINSPKFPGKGKSGPGHSLSLLVDRNGRWDKHKFESILIDLTQTSLLQTWSRDSDECHFSLHPLVKDWILLRTSSEAFWSYYVLAANIVADILRINYDYYDIKLTLADLDSTLSHIDAYMENKDLVRAGEDPSIDRDFADLHESESWFARALDRSGRSKEAYVIYNRVLNWRETNLGPEHELTLEALDDSRPDLDTVGMAELGKLIAANWRLIKGYEKLLGKDHVKTYQAYNNLFQAMMESRDFAGAKEVFDQHIKHYEEYFGPDNHETAVSLLSRAWMLALQDEYPEAEALFLKNIEMNKRIFGEDHTVTLSNMTGLAYVLSREEKYEEEETMRLAIAERRKRSFGQQHPETLFNLQKLVQTFILQKRYSEAEAISRDLVERKTKLFGRNHSETLVSIASVAQCLAARGELHEAGEIWKELNKLRQSLPDHTENRQIYNTYFELALVLSKQDQKAEAEECFRKCWEGEKRLLGEDSTETITTESWIARMQHDQGKLLETDATLHDVLDRRARVLGAKHANVLSALKWLWAVGEQLANKEKYTEAEDVCKRALDSWGRIRGEDDLEMLECLRLYETILVKQEKMAERVPVWKRLIEMREKKYGIDHADCYNSRTWLELVLSTLERHAERVPNLKTMIGIKERTVGVENEETLTVVLSLGEALRLSKEYKEAEEYYWRVYNVREKALGEKDQKTLFALSWITEVLWNQEKLVEAEIWTRKLCDARQANYKAQRVENEKDDQSLGSLLGNLRYLGTKLGEQKKEADRSVIWERIIDIQDLSIGPDHSETLYNLKCLADGLKEQKRYRESVAVNLRIAETKYRLEGDTNKAIYDELHVLELLLRKNSEWAEAEVLLRFMQPKLEALCGMKDARTVNNVLGLAFALEWLNEFRESDAMYRRALEVIREMKLWDITRFEIEHEAMLEKEKVFLAKEKADEEKFQKEQEEKVEAGEGKILIMTVKKPEQEEEQSESKTKTVQEKKEVIIETTEQDMPQQVKVV